MTCIDDFMSESDTYNFEVDMETGKNLKKWAEKYPSETRKPVEQIKVQQIKEKFSTLRYYVSGGDEHTNAVISFAEFISGYICEKSGATDDIIRIKKGWIKTLQADLVPNNQQVISVYDEELNNIFKEINDNK